MNEEQFRNFECDPSVRAIAKGVDNGYNYRKLSIACKYLDNPECLFVATNDDPSFIAGPSGRMMPDVGATLKSIETGSGREAFCIGKPNKYAFEAILADHF